MRQTHVSLSNDSFIDLHTVHSKHCLDTIKNLHALLIKEQACVDTLHCEVQCLGRLKNPSDCGNASSLCSIMKPRSKEMIQNP